MYGRFFRDRNGRRQQGFRNRHCRYPRGLYRRGTGRVWSLWQGDRGDTTVGDDATAGDVCGVLNDIVPVSGEGATAEIRVTAIPVKGVSQTLPWPFRKAADPLRICLAVGREAGRLPAISPLWQMAGRQGTYVMNPARKRFLQKRNVR